jgi:hypothetical protein
MPLLGILKKYTKEHKLKGIILNFGYSKLKLMQEERKTCLCGNIRVIFKVMLC